MKYRTGRNCTKYPGRPIHVMYVLCTSQPCVEHINLLIIAREQKTARGHLMPPHQRLYNGRTHPADYSIFFTKMDSLVCGRVHVGKGIDSPAETACKTTENVASQRPVWLAASCWPTVSADRPAGETMLARGRQRDRQTTRQTR